MKTKQITVVKQKPPARAPNVKTYAALRARVKQGLTFSWQKIEKITIQTHWETGRLISAHILQNGGRAAYGKGVVLRLARDLKISDEVLYQAKRFYETYPISNSWGKLPWSQLRLLSRISSSAKRLELQADTLKAGWTTEELEKKVRAMVKPPPKVNSNGKAAAQSILLEPKKGKIGIFQIVGKSELNIDLGFTSYVALPEKDKILKAGDFIHFGSNKPVKAKDAKTADLFTYEAELERVVDADTFWMKIWLRRPLWLREKLRLRGLDAPELSTKAGRAVKRFVELLFKKAVSVTVATTKPDKWDRYLSDVFVKMPDGNEIFLNNLLLEKDFAVRKDKFSLLDWEK